MREIYLTRHGRTNFNVEGKTQGWADSPLTEDGIMVVEKLGKALLKKDVKFTHAFSSDLKRASDTTKVILENSEQNDTKYSELHGLREWCFGKYEGNSYQKMWDEIAVKNGHRDMEDLFDSGVSVSQMADMVHKSDETHKAETWEMIKKRLLAALDEIVETAAEEDGKDILVVSHGLTIRSILEILGHDDPKLKLKNATVTKIRHSKNGKFEIESVNEEY